MARLAPSRSSSLQTAFGISVQGLLERLQYRSTSLIRKCHLLGPYRGPMPRVIGGLQGGGRFLMGEVPLYVHILLIHVYRHDAQRLSNGSQGYLAHKKLPPTLGSP